MTSHSFDTTKPVHLRVEIPAGDIQITVHDSPTVEIDLDTPKDPALAERLLVEHTAAATMDRVAVTMPRDGGFGLRRLWDNMRSEVFADIRLPLGATLELETASADVAATGDFAAAKLSTASGDFEVDHLTGKLDARSASGSFTVDSVDGSARVKTASGDVRIGRLQRDGSIATASGGVTVGPAHGALVIKTASGDTHVTETSEARLETASGDISVERAGAGTIVANAVSGDIAIGVSHGVTIQVNAGSVTGNLSSEIALSDEAPLRGSDSVGLLKISARTVNGDVRITRTIAASVA